MKKKQLLLLLFSLLMIKISAQELVMAETNVSAETKGYSFSNSSSSEKTEGIFLFEFYAYDYTDVINRFEKGQLGNNYFGEDVARKEKMFTDLYTYQIPVGPGSPATKTVIRKPAIYMATKKLYKYYKNEVKSNKISIENASQEYENILEIALSAVHQESEKFEDELGNVKNTEDLSKLFKSVVLIQ